MVLPTMDNKSIKKTREDPSPTESKINIMDSDNFYSWIGWLTRRLISLSFLLLFANLGLVDSSVNKYREQTSVISS